MLDPLVAAAGSPEIRVLSALAGATVASVHRQLGRHGVAQGYDEMALSGSERHGEAGFDALLGLAADAVGLGDAETASARLGRGGRAGRGARPSGGASACGWAGCAPRSRCCRAGPGTRWAARGRPSSWQSRRGRPAHVAKGLLFLGIAQLQADRAAEAAAILRRAALLAESLGTLPLQWPVRAVLGALVAGSDEAESERCLASARAGPPSPSARTCPEVLRAEWLARPDVDALLGLGGGSPG